eukprot:5665419-Pyramimonas_sp.AAC.1
MKGRPVCFCAYNGNCWATAEQEHKLTLARQKDSSAWIMLQGWRSFWSAPELSGQGNATGGACILVRRHLDAWSDPEQGASVMARHVAHCFQRTSGLGLLEGLGGQCQGLGMSGGTYCHAGDTVCRWK